MTDGTSWGPGVWRAAGGALLGLALGAPAGGIISVFLDALVEAADPRMTGLSTIASLVFATSALFSGGASALAGGFVAARRSRGFARRGGCGFSRCAVPLLGTMGI